MIHQARWAAVVLALPLLLSARPALGQRGDLKLDQFEVLQIVQDSNNEVPLIEGRRTWVRLLPTVRGPRASGFDAIAHLAVKHSDIGTGCEEEWISDSREIAPGYRRREVLEIDGEKELDGFLYELPNCCVLTPGTLTFQASLKANPPSKEPCPGNLCVANESITHSVTIHPSKQLDISYVLLEVDGKTAREEKVAKKSITNLLQWFYPLALKPPPDNSVEYGPLHNRCIRAEIVRIGEIWPGSGDPSQMISLLNCLWQASCDSPHQLVGWLPTGSLGNTSGVADAGWAPYQKKSRVSLVVDDQYRQVTLPHEIAHNLGLKDHLSNHGQMDERFRGELGYESRFGNLETRLHYSGEGRRWDLMQPKKTEGNVWVSGATFEALRKGLENPPWWTPTAGDPVEDECNAKGEGFFALRGVMNRRGAIHFYPVAYFPRTDGAAGAVAARQRSQPELLQNEPGARYRFELSRGEGIQGGPCESIPWSPALLADDDSGEAPFSFLIPDWQELAEVKVFDTANEGAPPIASQPIKLRDLDSDPLPLESRTLASLEREGDQYRLKVVTSAAGPKPVATDPAKPLQSEVPPGTSVWLRSGDGPWQAIGFDLQLDGPFDPNNPEAHTFRIDPPPDLDNCQILVASFRDLQVDKEIFDCRP